MNNVNQLVSGTLHVADWVLVTMVTLAVISNAMILWSRLIKESFFQEAIRRMTVGGFAVLAVRWWVLLVTNQSLNIHPVAVMGLTLVAMSHVFGAFYLLFADEMDAYSDDKNIYGSQHDS